MIHQMKLKDFMQEIRPGDEHSWADEIRFLKANHSFTVLELIYLIVRDGIQTPIKVGPDNRCWDGHHRVTAAHILNLEEIPVQYV